VPRYYYHCDACEGEFEIRHRMFETQTECLKCFASGMLTRIPQLIQRIEARDNKETPKDRVTAAIEENRQTLKQMKKDGRLDDID